MRIGLLIALLISFAGTAGPIGSGSWWRDLTSWVTDGGGSSAPMQGTGEKPPVDNGSTTVDPYG